MLVKIGDNVVGLVEGTAFEFVKEGGIEPHYGSETGKHGIGTRKATFSIRRWMFVDNKKKLLYDLYNGETLFTLEFGINDAPSSTSFDTGKKIVLSDCIGYRWRPVTGAANDTVGEELIGEAVDWIDDDFAD
jgi:hypothetical protein